MHRRLTVPAAEVGDTTEYVDHRLRRVGAKKKLLSSDALTLRHEATAGELRDIDRIPTNALRLAARRRLGSVDASSSSMYSKPTRTREVPNKPRPRLHLFTVLDSVLALVQSTVAHAPAIADDDPDLVDALLGLIAALHFLARRYRVHAQRRVFLNILAWPSPRCARGERVSRRPMTIIRCVHETIIRPAR